MGDENLSRKLAVVLAGCAAIAAFQLWLAWPDEVVARANPYDQLLYLSMAEEIGAGRWLGDFGVLTLLREPSYALWLAAVDASGLPLRLANELLLSAVALLLACALLRCGARPGLALAVFALVVLQPHAALANREVLPSSFYGALGVAALAGFGFALAARKGGARLGHAAWTGLVLGAIWTTRPEKPLVALLAAGAAVLVAVVRRGRGAPLGPALRSAAGVAALFAVGIALWGGGLASLNRHHYGVWRTSDSSAPGFEAANRALVSIAHDAPRRYVPVPADARERAYAASPTLRPLRPVLEGPSWARSVSCKRDGICDDLAGGYFLWLLREAAARVHGAPSARALDAALARIARELEEACRSGRLECRASMSSFLHPYPRTWLPELADSLGAVASRIAAPGRRRDRAPPRDPPDLPPGVGERFDAVANRRPELTRPPLDRVRARARVEGPAAVDVAVESGGARGPAGSEVLAPGAPAPGEASAPQHIPLEFSFAQPRPARLNRYPVLEFERRNGSVTRVPLPPAGESLAREGVEVTTETWESGRPPDRAQRAVRDVLWSGHALLVRVLTLAGVAGAVLLVALPGRRARPADLVLAVAGLMALAVAARVGLFAVIDASSFPARSSRYVYPVAALHSCAMLLFAARAFSRWRARRTPDEPTDGGPPRTADR